MTGQRVRMVCNECGHEDVLADAYVIWDIEEQRWDVENVFEKGGYCRQCDGEARYTAVPIEDEKVVTIKLTEADYELPSEQTSVWIGVENLSCYLHKTDEGVVVDIFPVGRENDESIASTYAFFEESADEDGRV